MIRKRRFLPMQGPDLPDSLDDIDMEYLQIATEVATNRATEEQIMHPDGLLNQKSLFERYRQEMQQEFTNYRRRQQNGAAKLALSLQELIQASPELFSDKILQEIEKLAFLEGKIAKDNAAFTEHIAKAETLQELAEIDDAAINVLYLAAKRLYDEKAYDDAADAFFFLTVLNPLHVVFWLGFANSEFYLQNYNEALAAYKNVQEALPEDLTLRLALCHCYEALGDKENALKMIDLALAVSGDDSFELEQEKIRLGGGDL